MATTFIQNNYTTADIKYFAQHFYKTCYLGSVDLLSWNDFCSALSKRQVYEAIEGICEMYHSGTSASFVLNLLEIITSPNNN